MNKQIRNGLGCVLLIVLDQLVKLWVLARLKGQEPIVLIKDVLEFRYIENRGAAFGILQNQRVFFLVITVAILAFLFVVSKKIPEEKRYLWLRLCMYFIAAGAVGNMIDRMFRHYVVDFIYFKLIDFPVFNVADIYVTCSAFALAYLIMFYYKEEELNRIVGKIKGKEQESEDE